MIPSIPVLTLIGDATLNPSLERASSTSECFLKESPSTLPTPQAMKSNGLEAVTEGSSCLKEPLAAFLGLAKGFSPISRSFLFSFSNSLFGITTSPLTSMYEGVGTSPFMSLRGTVLMVFTLAVTSSPTNPSPLVDATSSTPFLYTISQERPSYLGSAAYSTLAFAGSSRNLFTLASKSLSSASFLASCRESIGIEWGTGLNPS